MSAKGPHYDTTNRELIVRIDERLEALIRKVDDMRATSAKRLDSHADRLSRIERHQSKQWGATAIMAFLITIGGGIIALFKN